MKKKERNMVKTTHGHQTPTTYQTVTLPFPGREMWLASGIWVSAKHLPSDPL